MHVQRRNMHPDRFRNRFGADTAGNLASEPEIFGNATGICAEVVQNGSQMSVRRVYAFINSLPWRKRKIKLICSKFRAGVRGFGNNADPPPPPRPEDAIPDRPMSKFKKQAGRHLPPRVSLRLLPSNQKIVENLRLFEVLLKPNIIPRSSWGEQRKRAQSPGAAP